ncbi:hypothetical protein [Cupriavidus laharis]|uniref:hypothetical protein n=1 Tax=Cupriavidus laharis TaxID=151654 RepID=UPI001CC52942|nr:hypothetical protein [Cupriavidus laharis]
MNTVSSSVPRHARELDIDILFANSSPAKARVDRMNGKLREQCRAAGPPAARQINRRSQTLERGLKGTPLPCLRADCG